jgi:hypothetical protein
MESVFRELTHASMDLCINAGIMVTALSDERYPEEVRENFEERMAMMIQRFHRDIEAIQAFGEAFDDS